MLKSTYIILISGLLFLVIGVFQITHTLKEAPSSFKSDVYSLENLNKTLKLLEPINEDHDKITSRLNNLAAGEGISTDEIKSLVPLQDIFLEELPQIASRGLWQKYLSSFSSMSFKNDGSDTWGIYQQVNKINKQLEVKYYYYLKSDHHHLFVTAKRSIALPYSSLAIIDYFPEDNEYFVPINRVLKYSSQFLEIHQDKAVFQNYIVSFYKKKKTYIIKTSIIFSVSIFAHLFVLIFFQNKSFREQKKFLNEGIINKKNPFYSEMMSLKKEIISKNAAVKSLNEKVHRSQTFKRESESRVQVLEKFKRELEIERNRFEKISLEKVNLLSFVGHDLRAPLSNILTTSKILKKSINADQEPHLQLIQKNAEDGLDLISGLLKSGGKKTGEEDFKINILIEEVISLCDNISSEKKISIEFSKSIETYLVRAQKLQVKQMLLNVVRNAIKYSTKQTIIEINLTKHKVLPRNIVITITDQGPGIPPGELENIFKSYYRLNRDNSIEGSGVGLSFCRQICHQHGGTITANSDGSNGTTFEISLPIYISPDNLKNTGLLQLDQMAGVGVNDNEIIIIDDNQETASIIAEKFENITKSIHVYHNGDQLLRKLKLYPDLLKLTKIIILDFEIPGTKGVDLINKISTFMKDREIPIVFFSGKIESIGTAAVMKAEKIFSKKNEFKNLYQYVESLFVINQKVKNILVIDDSEDIHYLLEVFFEDGPIATNPVFCKSLKDGLKLIRENHHFWDIVFTDLNIGNEKGEELIYTLGRENIKGKTKVIAMSAMIDESKRLDLINIGFSEAVSKNFDQAIINSLIKY